LLFTSSLSGEINITFNYDENTGDTTAYYSGSWGTFNPVNSTQGLFQSIAFNQFSSVDGLARRAVISLGAQPDGP